mmetsp:Transcript_11252/g.33433  ORF Transcript_11252/g.33433 Transcript_11252/m.33433 type:complete len:102 (-) Transcript_11252:459-764(-)
MVCCICCSSVESSEGAIKRSADELFAPPGKVAQGGWSGCTAPSRVIANFRTLQSAHAKVCERDRGSSTTCCCCCGPIVVTVVIHIQAYVSISGKSGMNICA